MDQAAWTEQICNESYIQCSCGATFDSAQEWDNHNMSDLLNSGSGHSYSTKPLYTTLEHLEQGHYEEIGHQETIVVEYKCSLCGETK